MRLHSATYDEVSHLAAGYSYVSTGDLRLNPQHPPLAKLLAGLALIPLEPTLDLEDGSWRADPPDEWRFGYRFLYELGNDADRLLFWGRLPFVGLSLLLAWLAYLWARDLFGRRAGWLALMLCAFSPNLIAHGQLVTTDLPLACFSTLALYNLWRFNATGSRPSAAVAGVGLGAALACKFSALILIPLFPILLLLGRRRDASLKSLLSGLAIALGLAFLVVQASYLFSLDGLQYWRGVTQTYADATPDHPWYLMGEFRVGGWWYYFAAAFLFKTPGPVLIGIGLAGAALGLRKLRTERWQDELFLVFPIAAYFLVTSLFAANIGLRYLLPVYPLIFVFTSRLGPLVTQSTFSMTIAALWVAWYLGAALAIYPDHLSYFNRFAGGPENGHRLLDDSNIDWAQDFKRLADHIEQEEIPAPIKLRYGRWDAPDYYGLKAVPLNDREWGGDPPPGVYALGTHQLIRGELYAQQFGLKTDWLSRYEPIARIGYSCYLFRFD